jgi:hypothetical protein
MTVLDIPVAMGAEPGVEQRRPARVLAASHIEYLDHFLGVHPALHDKVVPGGDREAVPVVVDDRAI